MKTDLTLAMDVQLKRLNPFNPMDNPCYLIDIACVAMQMHTWTVNDRESLISSRHREELTFYVSRPTFFFLLFLYLTSW